MRSEGTDLDKPTSDRVSYWSMAKISPTQAARIRDVERAREVGGRKVLLSCGACGRKFDTVSEKRRHKSEGQCRA